MKGIAGNFLSEQASVPELTGTNRRLTIILDRPESIRESDIDASLPEASQILDLPGIEDNTSNLQASIALTRIFNDAIQ